MLRTAIIAMAKMEELYLRDWVEYHKSLGITHIYIADNNDNDYQPSIYDVLSDYKDYVTIFDYSHYKPHPHGQSEVYTEMMERIIKDEVYDWYTIIDIDEYISLPQFDNIEDFLLTMPDNADYIALIWKYFTDNNLLYYEDKPVYERFTEAKIIKKDNGYITKSIYRHSAYMKIRHIDRQHCVFQRYMPNLIRVDVLGNVIDRHETNVYIDDSLLDIIYNYACLNHYMYKTAEEYAWKIIRGDVLNYTLKPSSFFILNEYSVEKENILKTTINN